jgi:hypothetical protein
MSRETNQIKAARRDPVNIPVVDNSPDGKSLRASLVRVKQALSR